MQSATTTTTTITATTIATTTTTTATTTTTVKVKAKGKAEAEDTLPAGIEWFVDPGWGMNLDTVKARAWGLWRYYFLAAFLWLWSLLATPLTNNRAPPSATPPSLSSASKSSTTATATATTTTTAASSSSSSSASSLPTSLRSSASASSLSRLSLTISKEQNNQIQHLHDPLGEIQIHHFHVEGGPHHTSPLLAYVTYSGPKNCEVAIQWHRKDVIKTQSLPGATDLAYYPTADDLSCTICASVFISHPARIAAAKDVFVPKEYYSIDPSVASEVERCVKSKDVCWDVASDDSAEFLILRVNHHSVQLFRNQTPIFNSNHLQDVRIHLDHYNPFGFLLKMAAPHSRPISLLAQTRLQRDIILLTVRSYIIMDQMRSAGGLPIGSTRVNVKSI